MLTYKNLQNHVLKIRDFILDLIFPKECLNCGHEGAWLCNDCFSKLQFSSWQYCLGCKIPNQSGKFCSACRRQYHLDGILIAGNYDDKLLNQLIKTFKYHFVQDIATILGNYLVNFLQKEKNINSQIPTISRILKISNIPIIVPVPLHNRRESWRGFNQAEKLAKVVAQNFHLEINTKDLIRIKHRQAQSKLNEQQRLKNVANCFNWQGENLTGADIILIDDVVTTGATLNECAKVMKRNGAGKVWGLVVAKG